VSAETTRERARHFPHTAVHRADSIVSRGTGGNFSGSFTHLEAYAQRVLARLRTRLFFPFF
jgi:hypothetical protein